MPVSGEGLKGGDGGLICVCQVLVRKLKVVPYECSVRGYLTGSGWAEYKKQGTVNGQPLREGYQNASKLDDV